MESWEIAIASLMKDLNCDIYITGSNAFSVITADASAETIGYSMSFSFITPAANGMPSL